MPVAGIVGAVIAFILARTVARIILALGITAVTVIGFDVLLNNLQVMMADQLAALPSQVGQLFELMQVQNAFSILVGVYLAKVTIQGLTRIRI